MFQLRPYQQTAIEESRIALKDYRRVLLQSPTGSGKTVMFSFITKNAVNKGRRVLIISSRTELLRQNGGALERMGLNVEYIDPRTRKIPTSAVVCAMAQTLKRRLSKAEWLAWLTQIDFVIVDECHEQTPDFIYDALSKNCFVLGCTATPRRYGHQRQLGEIFNAMVTGVTVKTLIGLGFLSNARHFSVVAPKLDDVPIDYGTGDYNRKALAACFEDKRLYEGVVDEYLRICPNSKAVFFCCSARQTIEMTKELCSRGVTARYLLSGNFDEDSQYSGIRSDLIDSFHRGEFQVLVNCGIAIAGFDEPSVECVVLNFSTVSLTKYLQAVGRGSRVTDTKHEFFILDAGENYRKHGAYDAEREWCLWHSSKISTGEPMLKLCDHLKRDINGKNGCDTWVPLTCSYCPKCGFKFITEKDAYQIRLEELASDDMPSVGTFCAQKKLEGWNTNRILVQVLLSNAGREKEAFIECCDALGLKHSYWYFFKKNIWGKFKKKRHGDNQDTLPLGD